MTRVHGRVEAGFEPVEEAFGAPSSSLASSCGASTVAAPLGLDAWIGLPEQLEPRVARIERDASVVRRDRPDARARRDGVVDLVQPAALHRRRAGRQPARLARRRGAGDERDRRPLASGGTTRTSARPWPSLPATSSRRASWRSARRPMRSATRAPGLLARSVAEPAHRLLVRAQPAAADRGRGPACGRAAGGVAGRRALSGGRKPPALRGVSPRAASRPSARRTSPAARPARSRRPCRAP